MIYQYKPVNNFGDWLEDKRKDYGIKRCELADKSDVSLNMIYHIEHDLVKAPSVIVVEKLLNAIGYELVIQKKGKHFA